MKNTFDDKESHMIFMFCNIVTAHIDIAFGIEEKLVAILGYSLFRWVATNMLRRISVFNGSRE